MNKKILIIIILLTAFAFAQDMRQNAFSSLFSDQKANKIGDALTILVVESSQASNSAQKSSGKKSDLGFNLSSGSGAPTEIGINSNNDFKGGGSTQATGVFRTKISATIDSVLANGNLLIKGSRKIIINSEEQTVYIKGIVRTSDISADNTVLSYNISEAEITFEGNVLIDKSLSPGLLTKFLHWIF